MTRTLTLVVLLLAGCDIQPPDQLARGWAASMGYHVEAVACYNTDCSLRVTGVSQPIAIRCNFSRCYQAMPR